MEGEPAWMDDVFSLRFRTTGGRWVVGRLAFRELAAARTSYGHPIVTPLLNHPRAVEYELLGSPLAISNDFPDSVAVLIDGDVELGRVEIHSATGRT